MTAGAILKLEDVSKRYEKGGQCVEALEATSLELAAGDFTAVQGPSGCGKTTLLLASGGLLRPDGGSVEVAGADFYALAPEARARHRAQHVGFVFQQFHLIPYLTVIENVMTPATASPVENAADKARELLTRFGLCSRADHLPGELSTGEQQRTALSRALLPGPKLLLADEPTGNLDKDNAARVLDAFRAFADDGGAVLWVTHDDTVIGHAGRCIRFTK